MSGCNFTVLLLCECETMKQIYLWVACVALLTASVECANADLIFNVTQEGSGARFTAAGFSGNLTAQPPHPTIGNFNYLDVIFPLGFFSTGSGNHLSSFSNLTLNGGLFPQVYILNNWKGAGHDVLRMQNNTALSGLGAITSFSGSFVINSVNFSSLILPSSSSTYAVDHGYQAGLVTLNAGAAAVPEPSSMAVLGVSLVGFVGLKRRRWLQVRNE